MVRAGLGLLTLGVLFGAPPRAESDVMTSTQLRTAMDRYAPVEVRMDLSRLPASERAAVGKLVEGCRVMDALYLRQEWGGNGEGSPASARRAVICWQERPAGVVPVE